MNRTGNRALTVLIVDDEESYRMLIRSRLEVDGYFQVVGEANNGQAAVQRALELRPDVVLMDISMPVMDGLHATSQITDAHPDCRVIIVSGLATGDHVAAGAFGRIDKADFSLDSLRRVLDTS